MDQHGAATASHGATFSPKRWWSHPVPAAAQPPLFCASCKGRALPKSELGLEHAQVPSLEPGPLPQGFHQLQPHHAAHTGINYPLQPHANPQTHQAAPHQVPQRDDVFHKRPAEEELHTNVFYTAVEERTGLHAIKGLFSTQLRDKPSIKFPLYAREDDDEDMAINPCVIAAATLLILLTLSVVFFLFKTSQLMGAMEKTTPTEEPTTRLRPRHLEVAHSTSETVWTRERSSTAIVHSTAAEEAAGEPLEELTEVTTDDVDTLRYVP